MSTRVAVRIVKRDGIYHVIGRQTATTCDTFDEAWAVSIPYFAGRKR